MQQCKRRGARFVAASLVTSLVATSLFLAGCSSMKDSPNQTGGAILGGIGGAAIGSMFGKGHGQLVGVAVGALAGSMLGSHIGRSMDETSQLKAQQTTQHTLEAIPTGQVQTWHNPDKGTSGTVQVQKTYQHPSTGSYCREYVQTVTIGGQTETLYGTACRQPDGSWKQQN